MDEEICFTHIGAHFPPGLGPQIPPQKNAWNQGDGVLAPTCSPAISV